MEELVQRLQTRWRATIDPWWLAPGALALVVPVAVLAQFLEPSCCSPPPILGWPALAFIVGMWVLVTCGSSRPFVLLVLVLLATALRMVWSYDDLTPLFLLLVPAWAGYILSAPRSLIMLALSGAAIVPELVVLKVEPYLGLAWWLGMIFSWLTVRDIYIASLPDAGIAHNYRDLSVRVGLAGFYITPVVLLAPLLLMLRRWHPPFGAATLLFSIPALLVSALEEFQLAPLIVAAAVAGLVADSLIAWLRPSPARVGAYRLFAGLVPVALWSAYFATVAVVWGTWWTVNLVGGAIGMSCLAGAGLATLMTSGPDRR